MLAPPSLHEVEQTLSSLWLKESVRESFLKGEGNVSPRIAANIDKSGVELYATLLEYGQQDLMASIYPYCAKILKKKWEPTVREYFLAYPPNHYNLNRAAQRFPTYLKSEGSHFLKKYPFLVELADYEWLEMELLEVDDEVKPQPNLVLSKPDHFIQFAPLLNPVLLLRQYEYPISEIVEKLDGKKSISGIKPRSSRVAIYRHPLTNHCKYLDVGEIAFEVIQASIDVPHSYSDLISLAVSRSTNSDPQKTVVEFLDLVEKLQEIQVFIGSTKIA
ncbi:MAG: putative DNA-binding domain-containing protein [Cyanobacteria bacterium SZAS-4]|nr:putative DNA-binding domain-containing protein [Cyanobacteria bacterium SZAS-4]